MKPQRLPFRYLLPLLSILLWVVLIGVRGTIAYVHLQQSAHGAASVTLHAGNIEWTIPRDRLASTAFRMAAIGPGQFLQAVNLAGLPVDILMARILGTWPSMWNPDGFSHIDWPGVAYPFYCLPFWFFAGFGIDALLGRPARWPWLLAGTLACLTFLVFFLGMRFGLSADERNEITKPIYGFLFWAILLAVFPASWFRRKRNR